MTIDQVGTAWCLISMKCVRRKTEMVALSMMNLRGKAGGASVAVEALQDEIIVRTGEGIAVTNESDGREKEGKVSEAGAVRESIDSHCKSHCCQFDTPDLSQRLSCTTQKLYVLRRAYKHHFRGYTSCSLIL